MRDHFETFRLHAAGLRDGEGLPGFVEQEFRDFLRCGWLAGGFARLRCTRSPADGGRERVGGGWRWAVRHLGVPAEVPAARPPRAYDVDDQPAPGLPEFDS